MELVILSVNCGQARSISGANGGNVLSAIGKSAIAEAMAFVGSHGLAGDQQANRAVHGGVDKAVYAYSANHWTWWQTEKSLGCFAGSFGENLTLSGADECDVGIGDRFIWDDAVLEVAQPRGPCATLDLNLGRTDIAQAMTVSGRCGWYLRVVKGGWASARGARCSRILARGGPSVREAFLARHDRRASTALRRRVHDAPELAESWRRPIARQLADE